MSMENQSNQTAEKTVHGPKALFWFLTLFFGLGITAFSTGGLWFQFINKFFPQEVIGGMVQNSFNQSALKWADASLIVAAPLFFLFSWLVRKAFNNGNLEAKNKVRTWITYIILFLSIATAVGDLITTVFVVLNGDYTARFIFKSLSILTIVIIIFVYYWLELRSTTSLVNSKIPKAFAIASAVIIVISFVGSFFIVDSPMTARSKAYDQTRINNLQQIQAEINNYYQTHNNTLPAAMTDLQTLNVYLPVTDPKTQQPYEYVAKGKNDYQLCAVFETSNKNEIAANQQYYPVGYPSYAHDASRTCFDLTITLLPGSPKPVPPIGQ